MEEFNKNQSEYYQSIGKGGIVKEGIFKRFIELIPAVGEHYFREDNRHGKLLLVGESNYFNDYPENVSVFKNAEKWYTEDTDRLIPEEMKTSVCNWKGGYRTFDKVYNIMAEVLTEKQIEYIPGLHEAAFYNYFLRPALNQGRSKGFIPMNIDKEVSGVALNGIIEKLEPNLVIFLSKKAYKAFINYCNQNVISYNNVCIDCVSHPASIWWNRDGGRIGKNKLRKLLYEYWF